MNQRRKRFLPILLTATIWACEADRHVVGSVDEGTGGTGDGQCTADWELSLDWAKDQGWSGSVSVTSLVSRAENGELAVLVEIGGSWGFDVLTPDGERADYPWMVGEIGEAGLKLADPQALALSETGHVAVAGRRGSGWFAVEFVAGDPPNVQTGDEPRSSAGVAAAPSNVYYWAWHSEESDDTLVRSTGLQPEWEVSLGGADTRVADVAVVGERIIVVGEQAGRAWHAVYDSDGVPQFGETQEGGPGDEAWTAIAAAPDGGFAIGGRCDDDGEAFGWYDRFSADGSHVGEKPPCGAGNLAPVIDIAVTDAGDLVTINDLPSLDPQIVFVESNGVAGHARETASAIGYPTQLSGLVTTSDCQVVVVGTLEGHYPIDDDTGFTPFTAALSY